MNARRSLAVAALLAAAVVFAPVRAAEEKKGESGDVPGTVKHAAKSVWEDTKAVGRTIRDSKAGQATAEAGREVGHAAAEAGRDTADPQFCDACFSGAYPTRLTDQEEQDGGGQLIPAETFA